LDFANTKLRSEFKANLASKLQTRISELESSQAAKIRQKIKEMFTNLKERVTGNINDEIALIDASLQSILERKRQGELHAEREQQRLGDARTRINLTVARIEAAM
jgi:biotin-(acetyl-CoA carboxylase) ligase